MARASMKGMVIIMQKQLLVVDDDPHLRALVKTYGELEDFRCFQAENGGEAIKLAQTTPLSIIVLDVMMPGMDGFQTLAELRKFTETPVIMLTARKEEYDKLLGFNLGADDYLAKPFSPKELMARIRAVLKRGSASLENKMRFGPLEIQVQSRTVTIDGLPISLTPLEFDLLLFLSRNNHIVMDRDTILQKVWGYDYMGDTRTVDTHIKSLRDRLGDCRKLITTSWGIGYKFDYEEA